MSKVNVFVRWIHLLNVTGLRIAHCLPAGKTIVPPFPHDCMAEMMAGESSVPALPAEAGVQVARLASIVGVASWSSGDAVIQTDVVTRSSTQEKGRHIAEKAFESRPYILHSYTYMWCTPRDVITARINGGTHRQFNLVIFRTR